MFFGGESTVYSYISYLLIFVYIFNSTILYGMSGNIPADNISALNNSINTKLSSNVCDDNITIPEYYGEILHDTSSKNSLPRVILISDAHCNYDAQKNIAVILKILVNNYGV